MALIKCPECDREVSDSAETCPHCGYRLKQSTTSHQPSRAERIYARDHNEKMIAGIIGGILIIICGIVLFCCCGLPEARYHSEIMTLFVVFGIVCLLLGIGLIVYSAYRLKNY